jgi:NAD+ kinase
MKVVVVVNIRKPKMLPALDELLPWVQQRADVVAIDRDSGVDLTQVDADGILVLGGDGTLLSVARRLKGRQLPLMGVNFGRLGFLASFTPAQLKDHFESFVAGKLPTSSRMMIETSVLPVGCDCNSHDAKSVAAKRRYASIALNDAVITAGPPFRMIELELGANGDTGVRYFGDGVIISTPSGSTAYNVSAGGPIISPDVESICITPLCPHSLSFRPVVIAASATVHIFAKRVNAGTTLFCDGQDSTPITDGERLVVRRSDRDVLLVENPQAQEWKTLAEKLHWAVSPQYQK